MFVEDIWYICYNEAVQGAKTSYQRLPGSFLVQCYPPGRSVEAQREEPMALSCSSPLVPMFLCPAGERNQVPENSLHTPCFIQCTPCRTAVSCLYFTLLCSAQCRFCPWPCVNVLVSDILAPLSCLSFVLQGDEGTVRSCPQVIYSSGRHTSTYTRQQLIHTFKNSHEMLLV